MSDFKNSGVGVDGWGGGGGVGPNWTFFVSQVRFVLINNINNL